MREPCPWNWMPLLRRSSAAVSFLPVIVCIDLSAAVPDHGSDSAHDHAVAPSLILIPIQIMMLLGSMQIPHRLAPPQAAWRLCSPRPCRAAEVAAFGSRDPCCARAPPMIRCQSCAWREGSTVAPIMLTSRQTLRSAPTFPLRSSLTCSSPQYLLRGARPLCECVCVRA